VDHSFSSTRAPWALFGDNNGNFHARPFAEEGEHTLEVATSWESGCVDSAYEILTFTVLPSNDQKTDPPTPPPVPPPTLPPLPTLPPSGPHPFAHCEQPLDALPYKIAIQELQSPAGLRHSAGILGMLSGADGPGTNLGMVWFSNDIVEPQEGAALGGDALGTQTGHCVLVEGTSSDGLLACYFNFNVIYGEMTGRITAEALFDLNNFPAANLVITGGTGDFTGIAGSGCTSTVPGFEFDGTTFIYNFSFML